MKRILPFLALWFASCGEVKTGGFETSDLQARVVHPDGRPAAAARVWLVRSQGNSAPGLALDSSWTDKDGLVRFSVSTGESSDLGLDVQQADSLGLAPKAFRSSAWATVSLAPARKVTLVGDSTGPVRCFVPGSHFVSRPGADGTGAELALPQGTWNLAIVRGNSAPVVTPLALTKDSLVVLRPTASDSDTATRPILLPEGPDIFLDSFQMEGRRLHRDTSFHPVWTLNFDTMSSTLGTRRTTGRIESDSLALLSGPVQFTSGASTVQGWTVSELESIRLPEVGLMALRFHYERPADSDSGRYLGFQLSDSFQSGARINLNPKDTLFLDTFRLQSMGNFQDSVPGSLTTRQLMSSPIWYVYWTPNLIEFRNSEGRAGIAIATSPMASPPTLRILLGRYRSTPPGKVTLASARLYRQR